MSLERPNISCPRCRFRHPADRTCEDSKFIAGQIQHTLAQGDTIDELHSEIADLRMAVEGTQDTRRFELVKAAITGLACEGRGGHITAGHALELADEVIRQLA